MGLQRSACNNSTAIDTTPQLGTPQVPLKPTDQILRLLAEKHRKAEEKYRNIFVSRFSRDTYFGIREARLLAVIDPEGCERLALQFIEELDRDADAAQFGIEILALLTAQMRKGAEAALLGIASMQTHRLGTEAMSALYEVDHAGTYQSVYFKRAAAGDPAAVPLLATWQDPQVPPLLRKLVEQNPGKLTPESTIRLEAEDALIRSEILESPDYDQKLSRVLNEEDKAHFYWMHWALKMADIRPPANLLEICRARLNLSEDRALLEEQGLLEYRADTPGAATRHLLSAPYAYYTHDHYYDEFLLLYAKGGGKLLDFEQGRLNAFTDKGDPRECLTKLLADQK
jgi:hypothetical protein